MTHERRESAGGAVEPLREAASALALFFVIASLEYTARRFAARALPTLYVPRVNDMLVMGAAYVALTLGLRRLHPDVFGRAVDLLRAARSGRAWLGALAAFSTIPFALADQALWGSIKLPAFALSPNRIVLARESSWLLAASMLTVNALVVPIAEEFAWRGLVQPRLVRALGGVGGLALTALLFSLKHALVDASLGRLLTITAGGVVLGLVAMSSSWRVSAVSHVILNAVATAAMLGARSAR